MNLSVHPHHRRHLRPAVRRVLTVTVVACIAVGGTSFVLHSRSAVPAASGNFHVQRLGSIRGRKQSADRPAGAGHSG